MKALRWLLGNNHYEFKIVFATLAVLISLPIVGVVVLAGSGLSAVSSALASVNPVTKVVEVFDPNGNKVAEVQLSTTWPARGYVSDEFGTYDQFRRLLGLGPHTGIDIANNSGAIGDPVTPFTVGRVTTIDTVDNSACGLSVRVNHGNNIQSLYCHLSKVDAIEQTEVKPGDVIGLMGSTGTSNGSHVHLQIEVYGIPVNPRTFLTGAPEPSLSNVQY